MKNSRVNSITYGAMMAALLGVLLFVNRQLAGALDLYLFWIIPIPVIIYCLKFGINRAYVLGAAMLGVAFLVSTPVTLFYVAMSVVAGMVYSWGLLNNKGAFFLIASVTMVSLLIVILSEYVFAAFFGYSIAEDIKALQEALASFMPAGMTLDDNLLRNMLILASVFTSIMEGILVHLVAFLVLKRLKMPTPAMVPLSEIRAPLVIKIFVAFTLIWQTYLMITKNTQYANTLAMLMTVMLFMCGFFGYLLVLTWLEWKKVPRNSRIIYILLFFGALLFMPMLVIMVGCVDIFTDMRVLMMKEIVKNGQQNQ